VENFKKILISLCLISMLSVMCDRVNISTFESKIWVVTNPPTQIIRVAGPDFAFPTLDSICIERTDHSQPMQLELMTTITIPNADVVEELYATPIDSLENGNFIFDSEENGFYNLARFDFNAGVDKVTVPVSRPFTHESTYIFGIANVQNISVSIILYFHRTGNNEAPEVEVITVD